jgi:hypothetical protein
VHPLQKLLRDREARGRADDGINRAFWAERCLPIVNPFVNSTWRKGREAVEAPAYIALFDFSPMSYAVFVRELKVRAAFHQ